MAQIHALSPLDQRPSLRTYTQLLLCFPIDTESHRSQVVGLLQQASASLVSQIPILAGKVVNHKDPNIHGPTSGTFQVVPYEHPDGSNVRVNVLPDFVSYDELRRSQAPASMLDATILAPMKGFPDHYSDSDVTPVFIIQANFISGGLILCFAGMHNVMDGIGLGEVIRMFATLCRGEQLSAGDLELANLDRTQLPLSLKPGETILEHPELLSQPDEEQQDDPKDLPASIWSYFNIPAANLEELKAEGSKELTVEVPWVSANDAVTAWVWRAVTRARSSHIDTTKDTLLSRVVTGRRQLNIPAYLGNVATCPYHRISIKTLTEEPLSKITQSVRAAANSVTAYYVRSFANFVAATPDKAKLDIGFHAPDRDLMVSSCAAVRAYDSFGELLGRADLVRRPTSPWSSMLYIMPKRPDGSLDLLIALREDDMLRLRKDELFAAMAEYIG
ncbi:MAG: hypothetical protein Q9182_001529 [Xanthomendoza sp. 2 TL-2023]